MMDFPLMRQALQALREYRVPTAEGKAGEPDAGEPDPLKACIRLADGKPTAADINWISRAFTAYLSGMGQIPLERCLHLPNTHNAWRKLSRDQWLSKAASLLGVEGGVWNASHKLEEAWETFIQRGPWQYWRDDEGPPEYVTPLNEALFYATRMNRSQALNAKQISRIVGHLFDSKCR